MRINQILDLFCSHTLDLLANIVGGQYVLSLLVYDRTLLVNHIVIFKHFLTNVKVLPFDPYLCLLDG